jgi:hypothetical protein
VDWAAAARRATGVSADMRLLSTGTPRWGEATMGCGADLG